MNAKPSVYATLTDTDFMMPVQVMLTSLLAHTNEREILVMCFDDVSADDRARLEAMDARIVTRPIERIPLPPGVKIPVKAWQKAFARIQAFAFDEFAQVLMLDADMLVLESLEPLFGLPTPIGCSHHYPFRGTGPGFNGGLLLLEPDRELLRYMLEDILPMPSPYPPHSWMFSEQELVAALFSAEPLAQQWRDQYGIAAVGEMQFLDYRYNAITGLREKQDESWAVTEAKVLHYTCGPKPWRPIATDNEWNRIWARWYARAFPGAEPPEHAQWMKSP